VCWCSAPHEPIAAADPAAQFSRSGPSRRARSDSQAPRSRRPHGRHLAQVRAGGCPARQNYSASGHLQRQRPPRGICAALGARLCPIFRVAARRYRRAYAEFGALEKIDEQRFPLHPAWFTIVIVAMVAMLTRRPGNGAAGRVKGRRNYNKFYEARSITDRPRKPRTRPDIHALGKLPVRVRGDPWAAVVLHLVHVEDCSAAEARERYYDELGGEPCCQFLRTKERQGVRQA